jgi:hypothetical protein
MIQLLTGLGYGIIAFAVLIGIGIIILDVFGSNVANCNTGFTYQTNGTASYSTHLCCNNTASTCTGTANSTNPSVASQNMNTVTGYLGTGSGGLASWIPIIIVMMVGLAFLGYFMTKKGAKA